MQRIFQPLWYPDAKPERHVAIRPGMIMVDWKDDLWQHVTAGGCYA